MIVFIFIVIVSMIVTPIVIVHMYHQSNLEDLKYFLLFLLHITLFLEDISTLPYVWSSVDVLCKIMGWLHFYSGFANVLVVTLMGFHYLSYLLSNYPTQINLWIERYGVYLIFGLPLITLLPFSTDSYGVSNDDWCTLPSGSRASNNWAIIVFYSWIWLCIVINVVQLSVALYRVNKQAGVEQLRSNLFTSIGLYILITTICWLPRVIPRLIHLFIDYESSDVLYLITTAPLYLSGIGYAAAYYLDVQTSRTRGRTRSSVHSAGSINAEKIADFLGGMSSVSSGSFENPLYRGSSEFARNKTPVNKSNSREGVRKDSGVTENM